MFGLFKKKVPGKWEITIEEAIKKYGSASKVLDELCKDDVINIGFDPVARLLFMERKEKIRRQQK